MGKHSQIEGKYRASKTPVTKLFNIHNLPVSIERNEKKNFPEFFQEVKFISEVRFSDIPSAVHFWVTALCHLECFPITKIF